MVPSPQLQEALDTSLNLATPDARARFNANLGAASLGAEDHPPTLDDSVLGQLYAAVGDLARVLTRMTTEPQVQPDQARRTVGRGEIPAELKGLAG
jgi:hypothetical protein